MKKLLKYIHKVYLSLIFILPLPLLYPFFLIGLRKEKGHSFVFHLIRIFAIYFQYVGLIPVKMIRKTNGSIPPPYIICSNHSSHIDNILAYTLFKDPFVFMGKIELMNWPYIRMFFKHNMNISVDRANKSESHKAFLKGKEKLKKGFGLFMFPEGGIPYDTPNLKKFKNGAFRLAVEEKVPIIPVTHLDNWRIFEDASEGFGGSTPGISRVIIHDPISTKELEEKDIPDLREKVYDIIKEDLLKYGII